MTKREKEELEERENALNPRHEPERKESVLDFLHSMRKAKDFRDDPVHTVVEKPKGKDALEFVASLEKIRDMREFMKDPDETPAEEPMRGTQDSIYGPGNPAIHP